MDVCFLGIMMHSILGFAPASLRTPVYHTTAQLSIETMAGVRSYL